MTDLSQGWVVQAAVRWLVAVVGSALAFAGVAVPWAVLVKGGDDPWDVIGPVAGVVAAGVLAALGWWASQAGGAGTRRVRQSARGGGRIRQTGGSQGAGSGTPGAVVREDVRQRARSDGAGDIDQVGGNRG
ncbi:hypothetical protein [Streptomyces galbus]|uniref:hypothetical protein n=1 Tax=Streptomyces galbus TaxID=33898 RepID=UPI00144ADFCA|nr:hypothetical protein [Streptomyces galbus]GHD38469.1 hypothetical protein GCM10010335_37240 [Streptomyces galbus]